MSDSHHVPIKEKMKPMIVKKFDVEDRTDGLKLNMKFADGRVETVGFHDDDAEALADAISRVVGADDRPVREGKHVRK